MPKGDQLFQQDVYLSGRLLVPDGAGGWTQQILPVSGGAPTNASYVTMAAEAGLSAETLFSALIGEGTNASRPAAGTAGRLYRTTDNPQGLWKDTGSLWVPVGSLTVRKTADETVTNSTVLQNDSELLWSVAANEVWFFLARNRVNGANTTMDSKFGWSVPSGTTMEWGGENSNIQSFLAGVSTASTPNAPLTEASTMAFGTSAGNNFGAPFSGWVFVGANAGTVNLQRAQNTADLGNLIFKANSILLLWKLA